MRQTHVLRTGHPRETSEIRRRELALRAEVQRLAELEKLAPAGAEQTRHQRYQAQAAVRELRARRPRA